ncbi:NUMOD4 motif-containing HNH endonuclease [Fusobacterium varium]|uniref:NUMOD4 domain-containing protein n=1 Tax=Fusobacterium TaxID=848 RepID=UPI0030CE49DB
MEIWKDIKGYEGLYQVSNFGRVKSLERFKQNHSKLQRVPEKIKSAKKNLEGYLSVDLYKNNIQKTVRVHRLVAEAFIENSLNKETVNHIDGDKSNNCVGNLEWATYREQNIHFYKKKLKSRENIDKAIKAMNAKLSKKVKCLNNNLIYISASEAGRQNNISSSLVMKCCRGERKTAGKDNEGNLLSWIYL